MKIQQRQPRSANKLPIAFCLSLVLAGSAMALSSQVQAQTQTAQNTAAPAGAANAGSEQPKSKKIWTEEDLASLRRPWDLLVDQQDLARQLAADAAEKGDADASTQPAKPPAKLSDGSALPSSASDLQQKIDVVQKEILQLNADLDATKQAYLEATQSERREKLKANIELLQDELKENGGDLTVLQNRLQALKLEQSGQPSNAPPNSENPQPTPEPTPQP